MGGVAGGDVGVLGGFLLEMITVEAEAAIAAATANKVATFTWLPNSADLIFTVPISLETVVTPFSIDATLAWIASVLVLMVPN